LKASFSGSKVSIYSDTRYIFPDKFSNLCTGILRLWHYTFICEYL
jgi:hypothetical protein